VKQSLKVTYLVYDSTVRVTATAVTRLHGDNIVVVIRGMSLSRCAAGYNRIISHFKKKTHPSAEITRLKEQATADVVLMYNLPRMHLGKERIMRNGSDDVKLAYRVKIVQKRKTVKGKAIPVTGRGGP
jgi:hypothetical protein